MIAEGKKAPDLKLPNGSGEIVQLSKLKGAPVVLYFYPKDDTKGCTAEALDFTAMIEDFHDCGARVIGISPDSVARHAKFADKHGLAVELLSDEDKKVLQGYGVWVEKSMYGRKYMGVERTTLLVDEKGKISRIWRKVKVNGHAKEVLRTLQELVQ